MVEHTMMETGQNEDGEAKVWLVDIFSNLSL